MNKYNERTRVVLPADCGEEIRFIFDGHRSLLTATEVAAYKRVILEPKAQESDYRLAKMIRQRWVSDDPEVARLLSDGPEAFYSRFETGSSRLKGAGRYA